MAPTADIAQAVAAGHPKTAGVNTSTTDAVDDNQAHALQIAHSFTQQLEAAYASGDAQQVAKLFRDDGWYKEILALQWDHRSQQGPANIAHFLANDAKLSKTHTAKNFRLETDSVQILEAYPGVPWIMGFFEFETNVGNGRGVFRLALEKSGQPKIHALFLGLEQLKGFEPKELENRIQGVEHGEHRGGLNWQQRRERAIEFLDEEPQVVIVGAGQAGLMLGYRLGMLDVPTLIVDTNERIGDNWRKRYSSLVLHDPVQYDHFAGLPFPKHWPTYTAKNKLANWMEFYAETMELRTWMSSAITESAYDEAAAKWTLKIQRKDGSERVLHPQHVVLATGHSGVPRRPRFPGEDKFKGTVCHSSEYKSGDAYPGKRAIVVGSNNSGQDISVNFVEHGWDVTQVQRSGTYFMSVEAVTGILLKGLWSDPGPKTEDADLIFNSLPNLMHIPMQRVVAQKIADFDREYLDGLSKAGVNVTMGADDAGFLMSYFKNGGGYYLMTGAEKEIINGKIKMKQGQQISHFTEDGLVFADGEEIKADVVVLATGYTNMKSSAEKIFGKEGSKMNEVWGLDDEGELKTVWRPSGHPGLWAQAGNLALNREMSKRLALNIKARLLGLA